MKTHLTVERAKGLIDALMRAGLEDNVLAYLGTPLFGITVTPNGNQGTLHLLPPRPLVLNDEAFTGLPCGVRPAVESKGRRLSLAEAFRIRGVGIKKARLMIERDLVKNITLEEFDALVIPGTQRMRDEGDCDDDMDE